MGWVDPWVGLGWVGLGWVGSGWVEFFLKLFLGWVGSNVEFPKISVQM